MTQPNFRALCAELAKLLQNCPVTADTDWIAERMTLLHSARTALATPPPEPPTVMEILAARPLLEQVARLGDCIGANTVGKIMAISSRAAAWLEANPPGQPVAIEPRGCPLPGACSCVEPATPPPEQKSSIDELIAGCKPLDPEMAEVLTTEAWWRLFGEDGSATPPPELLRPIPVSERLPKAEDCAPWPGEPEATPWCWAGKHFEGVWEWAQISMLGLSANSLRWCIAGGGWSHWLPYNAIPFPEVAQ